MMIFLNREHFRNLIKRILRLTPGYSTRPEDCNGFLQVSWWDSLWELIYPTHFIVIEFEDDIERTKSHLEPTFSGSTTFKTDISGEN